MIAISIVSGAKMTNVDVSCDEQHEPDICNCDRKWHTALYDFIMAARRKAKKTHMGGLLSKVVVQQICKRYSSVTKQLCRMSL